MTHSIWLVSSKKKSGVFMGNPFVVISTLLVGLIACTERKEAPEKEQGNNYQISSEKEILTNISSFEVVADYNTGLFLTPEQELCVETYPTLKPENIRAGVTISGVAGTAVEYPECSDSVTTNCITTSSHPAAEIEGLAAKVLEGQTVAGVAGTGIEAKPECTAANQSDCIATVTYKAMDLSENDAGGAVNLTNSNFESMLASSSTFEYWDENGVRHTSTGDADLLASNIDTGVNIFGIDGTAVAPDCRSVTAGGSIPDAYGTWVLVPGDPDYGTNDFCVMKYEAKNNSDAPTSVAAGGPWASIAQQEAITECASLGKGYHLITNDEWMTIATNIAQQGANWNQGVVPTGDRTGHEIAMGHTDNNPTQPCEADATDANAYVQGSCTGGSTGDFDQRRTHVLSNGEVIWDISGNVWEWTNYFNDDEKPTPNIDTFWFQWTDVSGTNTMPITDMVPTNAFKSFWNDDWNMDQSIGQYYPGVDNDGGALRRGGPYFDVNIGGIFTANLDREMNYSTGSTGFRCVVAVP